MPPTTKGSYNKEAVYCDKDKLNDTVLVGIRIRKPATKDLCVRSIPQAAGGVVQIDTGEKSNSTYGFDCVFPEKAENFDIWASLVRPCVEGLFKGIDSAIFAYGGTGSGKSYTMGFEKDGPSGQLHYAISHLFGRLKDEKVNLNVFINFVEIYGFTPSSGSDNASITDLLSPTKNVVKGQDAATMSSETYHVRVNDYNALMKVFNKANDKRQVGAQDFNAKSSRSHGVVQICIANKDWIDAKGFPKRGSKPLSRMSVVDLAGSEPAHLWRDAKNPAAMKRYNEAVVINQGLGALKSCMGAMAGKKGVIGNKNQSMLTRYLGSLLDKASKGFLRVLCTVNPIVGAAGSVASLSKGTLDYAKEIKTIKLDRGVETDLIAIAKSQQRGSGESEASTNPSNTSGWVNKTKLAPDQLLLQSLQNRGKGFSDQIVMNLGDVSPEIAKRRAHMDPKIEKLPREKRKAYTFDNGAVYTGEWKGNIRDGQGTMLWPDGTKYTGQFYFDYAQGKGKFEHANGDVYVGDLKRDHAHGKGEYRHAMGAVYTGDWKEDRKHGKGVEVWGDGSKFTGEFRDGKKHGKGQFNWKSGGSFKGDFFQNNIHGKGVYTWADKRSYDGEWTDGKMHGEGTFLWPKEKKKYVGQFVKDKKHGFGTFTSHDGRQYSGGFKNGEMHGKGFILDPKTKEKIIGRWENGKQVETLS